MSYSVEELSRKITEPKTFGELLAEKYRGERKVDDAELLKAMRRQLPSATRISIGDAALCSECNENVADAPSSLCQGCEAYREHQDTRQ